MSFQQELVAFERTHIHMSHGDRGPPLPLYPVRPAGQCLHAGISGGRIRQPVQLVSACAGHGVHILHFAVRLPYGGG